MASSSLLSASLIGARRNTLLSGTRTATLVTADSQTVGIERGICRATCVSARGNG